MEKAQTPHILSFNVKDRSREYGSNVYITKNGTTNRLQYRTSIIYAGLFQEKFYIFHLYKHDLYINNMMPDNHPYRLAQACANTFYPIIILCNKRGRIKTVRNDQIRKRWLEKKTEIEREFVGKYAEQYIKNTERRLKDNTDIFDLIFKETFFDQYFAVQYGNNLDKELILKERKFFTPSIDRLQVELRQKVEYEDNYINLIQEGEIIDNSQFIYQEVSGNKLHKGEGKIRGNYKTIYRLNANNFLIDAINHNATLKTELGDELLHTHMQSYYLSEYPLQSIEDTDTIALGKEIQKQEAQIEKQNRPSLWERFKNYLNEPL